MEGVIHRTGGGHVYVRTGEGEILPAFLRGKMRLKDHPFTNQVAVGDKVSFSREEGKAIIEEVQPRKNYLLRRDPHTPYRYQILASNLDGAILIFTLVEPFTPLRVVDSFLVMCEAYHVPASIFLNKVDLYQTQRLKQKCEDFVHLYESIGYNVWRGSATDPTLALRETFSAGQYFVAGLSGSGKSTLIQRYTGIEIPTRPLAKHTRRGRHTTTYTAMYAAGEGIWLIDSPGFSEFEVAELEPHELWGYFPEMRAHAGKCQYHNCLHQEEPGCAIRKAVEAGDIAHTRYHTYLQILGELFQRTSYA
ncbi:MAG: ribosome small subunit-dependent GTPase A [Bacteroidia bacterium]